MTNKQRNIIKFIELNTKHSFDWEGDQQKGAYEFIGKYWKEAQNEYRSWVLKDKSYIARGGCDPDTAMEYGCMEYF